jgi:TetR/AcrR family transcriptional regulator
MNNPELSPDNATLGSAERILGTAEQIFARSGFVGTRVDEIARAASINKRMIYYHFGNKEGLYQAVLEKNLAPLVEMSRTLLRDRGLHPTEMYRRLLVSYFDFLAAHRLYVRLVSWEIVAGGSRLSSLGIRRQAIDEVVDFFEEAQRQGRLRPDLEARDIVVAGLVLCFSYFSQLSFMQDFFSVDLDRPEQYERWKYTIVALIVEGSRMQTGTADAPQ